MLLAKGPFRLGGLSLCNRQDYRNVDPAVVLVDYQFDRATCLT